MLVVMLMLVWAVQEHRPGGPDGPAVRAGTHVSVPWQQAEDAGEHLLSQHPRAKAKARDFERAYSKAVLASKPLRLRPGELQALRIPLRSTASITSTSSFEVEASVKSVGADNLFRLVALKAPEVSPVTDGATVRTEGECTVVLLVAFDASPGEYVRTLDLGVECAVRTSGGARLTSTEQISEPCKITIRDPSKSDESALAEDLARTYRTLTAVLEDVEKRAEQFFERRRDKPREALADEATLANVLCTRLDLFCAADLPVRGAARALRDRIRARLETSRLFDTLVAEGIIPLSCFPTPEDQAGTRQEGTTDG